MFGIFSKKTAKTLLHSARRAWWAQLCEGKILFLQKISTTHLQDLRVLHPGPVDLPDPEVQALQVVLKLNF